MKRNAKVLLTVKLLLSVGLVVAVVVRVHPGAIVEALAKADPWLVGGWYALFPVTVILTAWRWGVLAPGLSFATAHKYTWIGIFYGHVLPGAIAGDVAKGVSLALTDASARSRLAASIAAEKVIGLAALVVFFDIACAVVWLTRASGLTALRYLAGVALLLSLAGVIVAVLSLWLALRIEGKLAVEPGSWFLLAFRTMIAAARFYGARPRLVVRAFVISLLIHLVNIFAFYVSFKALHLGAGFAVAAAVYPVVSVLLMIPISISGIGVRDATLAALFALFGLSAASGVAIAWLSLLATIPNVLIGGTVQVYEMYRKH